MKFILDCTDLLPIHQDTSVGSFGRKISTEIIEYKHFNKEAREMIDCGHKNGVQAIFKTLGKIPEKIIISPLKNV
jgi:hypothetical protein